jgi:Holliday junction resolvasome RuvABC endonuclease subunit
MKYDKLPNTNKLYIGVDQALTTTSICLMQNQEVHFIQLKPLYMGVSRISEIYDAFCDVLDAHTGDIEGVAIEGYAYSSKGAVFNLGEVGGVLRLACYQKGVRLIEVPPPFLKKAMTGKGNSTKDIMIKEAYKKYGIDINDNNDSDAFALAIVAADYYGSKFHPIKTYRSDCHKNCRQIIGDHPNPLDHKEYFAGMPDVTVAEYEKMRKAKKKELMELDDGA